MNILITGGAGFIDSNFINYFLKKYEDYNIINLDCLTYASNSNNLIEVSEFKNYKFTNGNINDKQIIKDIIKKYSIDNIIHFAAESHVDNSINSPEIFIDTNIKGTFNLLETIRELWNNKDILDESKYRFCHISTDEVFGDVCCNCTEETRYNPSSPYSASKAASDLLVKSYHRTFGINSVISNCSNNYGARQNKEKLIPMIITNALNGKPINIHGDGKQIRDWIYVEDHCKAIDLIFHKGKSGETYNIGGDDEKSINEVVDIVLSVMDNFFPKEDGRSYKELIKFVKNRAGQDGRYSLSTDKISNNLDWKKEISFEKGIKKTIEWYINSIKEI